MFAENINGFNLLEFFFNVWKVSSRVQSTVQQQEIQIFWKKNLAETTEKQTQAETENI